MGVVRPLSLTVATLGLVACSRAPQGPAQAAPAQAATAKASPGAAAAPSPAEVAAAIHARAGRRFTAVDLLRPDGQGELPFDVYLAPMIVQERLDAGTPGAPTPGEVVLGEDGRATVVAGDPTIYYARSTARLGGEEREQLAFLWWYPGEGDGLRAQGMRMTLGRSGVPILWEVLADPGGARLVFVSETLEERARQQHGEPLPGRRFSTERALEEAPQAVVARAILNGAMPMGPFVYLEAGSRAARTLLCRCSPAEYDDVAGETLYRLVGLATLGEQGLEKSAWTAELPALTGDAPGPQREDAAPNWLEGVLRLPDGV